MGQDEIHLRVLSSSGEPAERKNAAAVLKLLHKGKHWVLVTLLLSNVITNETLPIILDRSFGGGWMAVVGSTALIVIFGEVVPQSICVRYGLPIGAWMAPCVLVMMYLMAPIAWPIAKLLDFLLGEDHGTFYKKAGLKTLVTLHKSLGTAGEQLNSDEVTIISAVLDLKEKSVGSIMTPMEDVFTMSTDTVLDEAAMDLILSQGYSRIPIHAPDNPYNFVGMLLVKMLITYDPEDAKMVRDFALATLPETRPETSCLDIVNFFQEGKSHMVLVSDYPGEDHGALGVVTLEDVIEELIGEEIIDESDVFIDVHKAIRRLSPAPKARVPKGQIVQERPTLTVYTADEEDGSNGPPAEGPPRRTSSGLNQIPAPRFSVRNKPDAPHEILTKRGTEEVREHLKHLGPSNLASRPRQTRYQNVKIKTPDLTRTLSGGLTDTNSVTRSSDVSLPKSPESRAADRGYGTMDRSSPSSEPIQKNSSSNNLKVDGSRLAVPEDATETGPSSPKRSPSRSPHGSPNRSRSKPSSIRSYDSRSGDPIRPSYQAHGPARSGSITEQIIDVGGVKKVILQTTNGSPSEMEGANNEDSAKSSPEINQDSGNEQSNGEAGDDASKSVSKQKRRKKRKKNVIRDDERRPLLSE
ncbi:hypothetical protein VTN31DRAFT_2491 [Thermomyces dupontii]|uniref:uncharacterized protein n=1 Tax=Talaromyces thermophilus TaxID=28565 RepID=UPI003744549C